MLSKLKKYHKTLRRIFLNFISDVVDFFKSKLNITNTRLFALQLIIIQLYLYVINLLLV